MDWVYDDGGRSKYFKAKDVGDCVIRSVAIATGRDYLEVYNEIKALNKGESCRNGTPAKNLLDMMLKKMTAEEKEAVLNSYGTYEIPVRLK